MSKEKFYYEVAVEAPLNKLFTYSSEQELPLGTFVTVPFGKRKTKGVLLKKAEAPTDFSTKNIQEVRPLPPLPPLYLKWAQWISQYYFYPLGQTLKHFSPPLKKMTHARQKSRKGSVLPINQQPNPISLKLTEEQTTCVNNISTQLNQFYVHLLHGVTGSGKTEVYIELAKQVLAQGRQVLFLVPEIALTPQLLNRLSNHLGDQLAVIHSHLTPREKTNQWWSFIDQEKNVLLGARSALFCPSPNVGLIIIDEEHESSFKQEEQLKYHARDAAIMLSNLLDIPIVLGSATPSLESWNNVQKNKYHLHTMKKRVHQQPLPQTVVVDMSEKEKNSMPTIDLPYWLSRELYEALEKNLREKKQSALFLNRRGVSPVTLCHECGHVCECPNCSISLTLHGEKHLICHYCGYSDPFSPECPACPSGELTSQGIGTEKVEQDLKKLFPEAALARADRDEIQSRHDIEELIKNVEDQKVDILVGTQMIAKGLDFPKLSLVGILLADVGLNLPDFRASEKTFQLITQVSGRAGRNSQGDGAVVLQTYSPSNSTLQFSLENNFTQFANDELALREELSYPPFVKLARLRLQGPNFDFVEKAAELTKAKSLALQKTQPQYENLRILGPTQSPIPKINRKYRFHMLIKSPSALILRNFLKSLTHDSSFLPKQTKLLIDIDPVSML